MHSLVLDTLQNHYPARIAHILVVNPSGWTKVLIATLKPFMKKKLAQRIVVVKSFTDLKHHITEDQLPKAFDEQKSSDAIVWADGLFVSGGVW